MSLVALAFLSVLVVMASSQTSDKTLYDVANARPMFEQFMQAHKRQYKDDADKEVHYKAFVGNLEKINDMNAKLPDATFGINKYADYTEEERKSLFGLHAKKD